MKRNCGRRGWHTALFLKCCESCVFTDTTLAQYYGNDDKTTRHMMIGQICDMVDKVRIVFFFFF